jgi:hypothetical protein
VCDIYRNASSSRWKRVQYRIDSVVVLRCGGTMYDVRWMILASSRLDFVDAKQLLGDFVFRGTVLVPYRQGMRSCTGRNRRRDRGERRELAHYSSFEFATKSKQSRSKETEISYTCNVRMSSSLLSPSLSSHSSLEGVQHHNRDWMVPPMILSS